VGANIKAVAKWILLLGVICAAWLLTTSDREPAPEETKGRPLRQVQDTKQETGTSDP
jgi:hypothetical protein